MDSELKKMRKKFDEIVGGRIQHLGSQIIWYAEHPHARCDVTFYDRPALFYVTIGKTFGAKLMASLMYGAGARVIKGLLENVQFSEGAPFSLHEIWVINFMPEGLDLHFDTNKIDVSSRDSEVIGDQGETLREMISNCYHCKSRPEEDFFIARWIAS